MVLKDKNIFITGGNRGIGLGFAEYAAKLGLSVHIVCRTPPSELAENLKSLGAKDARIWQLDMSKREAIDEFIQQVLEEKVDVNILVNNAGQLTGGLLEDQSVDDIYRMMQVNLNGLIHLTHGLLPHMMQLREAKIVNNSSVSGKMFFPCASTYAASKAGVVAFTESLKQELRKTPVSTLLLVTAGVKTRMFDDIPGKYGGNLDMKFLSSIPAEDWAKMVFKAIEKDHDICWPPGSSYFGVKMGHHFPGLFERMTRSYFKR